MEFKNVFHTHTHTQIFQNNIRLIILKYVLVLKSLFNHLCSLKILIIPHCPELNDDVIEKISKNCAKLKELHIPHSSITDIGLKWIGNNLNNLSVLNILGTQVTL